MLRSFSVMTSTKVSIVIPPWTQNILLAQLIFFKVSGMTFQSISVMLEINIVDLFPYIDAPDKK